MDSNALDRSEKKKKKKKEKKKQKRCHSDAVQQGKCAITPVEVGKKRHKKMKHLLSSGTYGICRETANLDALGRDAIHVNEDIDSGPPHPGGSTKLNSTKKRKRSKEHMGYVGNGKQDKVAVGGVEAEKKLKRNRKHKLGRIGVDDISELTRSEPVEGHEIHFDENIMEKSLVAKGEENKNKKKKKNEDCTTNVHEKKVIKDNTDMNKENKKRTKSEVRVGISCEGKVAKFDGDVRKKKKKNKKKDASSVGIFCEDKMIEDDTDAHLLNNNGKERGDKGKKVKSLGSERVLKSKGMAEAGKPSNNPASGRNSKKVRFSGHVEIFSSSSADAGDQNPNDGLVRGKRFSLEEDELIRAAVFNYIEERDLGEMGVEMILNCRDYKEVKGCWKEITTALPWRPLESVYSRAHVLFERGEGRKWSEEECQLLLKLHEQYGSKWKAIADELGKHRKDVKDAYRRYKRATKKGHWSQDEYQNLFDLVSEDLRLKALTCKVKKKKHGMLRDNISWGVISDKLSTRIHTECCLKWYGQLQSPMVQAGKWADVDDYRMLCALDEIDASCEEEVDWDNLLDNRSGEVCLERWNQMVRYIGEHGIKTFPEQVEILSQRYCPELQEVREQYDSLPVVN